MVKREPENTTIPEQSSSSDRALSPELQRARECNTELERSVSTTEQHVSEFTKNVRLARESTQELTEQLEIKSAEPQQDTERDQSFEIASSLEEPEQSAEPEQVPERDPKRDQSFEVITESSFEPEEEMDYDIELEL